MAEIHPTALIHPSAQLAGDVRVGPYAIVEAGVRLGQGTELMGHAQVLRDTIIGDECSIGHAAVIGGAPQAKGFDRATPSRVRMGHRNVIREHVTIHRSMYPDGETVLGDGNFIMATAHLGHDVLLADECILANGVLLAGHVTVGSRVFLGGGGGFHQFIRIGDSAMVQGNASLSMDVPPFCVLSGLNSVVGLNNVGLKRQGYTAAARLELKQAFDLIYRGGFNLGQAVAQAQQQTWGPLAEMFVQFIASRGKKGVCTLRMKANATE
jgi:UDP-N-acetylglucosamine acyltransferase